MGVILNPRGVAGSGKTELVRRLLAAYGWRRGEPTTPIAGRSGTRLLGYRLPNPSGGRPLAVIGHYENTSGGCDRVRLVDGGLDEVFALAAQHAAAGHDVIMEGLRLSAESARSAELAKAFPLRILRLTTDPESCARNLAARRRSGADRWPALAQAARAEMETVALACDKLAEHALIEHLSFGQALARARSLLGLPNAEPGTLGA